MAMAEGFQQIAQAFKGISDYFQENQRRGQISQLVNAMFETLPDELKATLGPQLAGLDIQDPAIAGLVFNFIGKQQDVALERERLRRSGAGGASNKIPIDIRAAAEYLQHQEQLQRQRTEHERRKGTFSDLVTPETLQAPLPTVPPLDPARSLLGQQRLSTLGLGPLAKPPEPSKFETEAWETKLDILRDEEDPLVRIEEELNKIRGKGKIKTPGGFNYEIVP